MSGHPVHRHTDRRFPGAVLFKTDIEVVRINNDPVNTIRRCIQFLDPRVHLKKRRAAKPHRCLVYRDFVVFPAEFGVVSRQFFSRTVLRTEAEIHSLGVRRLYKRDAALVHRILNQSVHIQIPFTLLQKPGNPSPSYTASYRFPGVPSSASSHRTSSDGTSSTLPRRHLRDRFPLPASAA